MESYQKCARARPGSRGQAAETMRWPNPDKEPAVKTVILNDDTAPKRETIRWAREREAKVCTLVWVWWMDGSRSDNRRVGAAPVCKHGDGWKALCNRSKDE